MGVAYEAWEEWAAKGGGLAFHAWCDARDRLALLDTQAVASIAERVALVKALKAVEAVVSGDWHATVPPKEPTDAHEPAPAASPSEDARTSPDEPGQPRRGPAGLPEERHGEGAPEAEGQPGQAQLLTGQAPLAEMLGELHELLADDQDEIAEALEEMRDT